MRDVRPARRDARKMGLDHWFGEREEFWKGKIRRDDEAILFRGGG